jgi:hypothetical protein
MSVHPHTGLKKVTPEQFAAAFATSNWTSVGGQVRNTPTAPVSYGGNLYVFATNSADGSVGMCSIANGTGTGSWSSLGGFSATSPAVNYAPGGGLTVVAVSQTNQCMVNTINPVLHTGTGWSLLAATPNGVTFTGAPVLVLNVNQRLEIFINSSNGVIYHSWQAQLGTGWAWQPFIPLAGAGRPTSTALAQVPFSACLLANSGKLQVAALGTDGNFYVSTQASGSTPDGWSTFVQPAPTQGVQLANGAAAAYSAALAAPVYGAYNTTSAQGANPLVYAVPPALQSQFTALGATASQYPSAGVMPVIVNCLGVPTMVWLSAGQAGAAQVLSVTQSSASPSSFQWGGIQTQGAGNALFSGQIAGSSSAGNAMLAQLMQDGSVQYYTFSPTV